MNGSTRRQALGALAISPLTALAGVPETAKKNVRKLVLVRESDGRAVPYEDVQVGETYVFEEYTNGVHVGTYRWRVKARPDGSRTWEDADNPELSELDLQMQQLADVTEGRIAIPDDVRDILGAGKKCLRRQKEAVAELQTAVTLAEQKFFNFEFDDSGHFLS